jgi:DNA-binding XRE family transcriptional regulator
MGYMDKQASGIIGQNILRLRTARQISRARLARSVQHGEDTLESFEKGEQVPDYTTMVRLAEVFDVAIERIFDGLTIEPSRAEHPPTTGQSDGARDRGIQKDP